MAVTGDIKIGRSVDVPRRLKQLQTGAPYPLRLLLCGKGLGSVEPELHRRFAKYRIRSNGEWFKEECLGDLPVNIYNLIPLEVLETPDWWKDFHH